jgi:hypothetical protein
VLVEVQPDRDRLRSLLGGGGHICSILLIACLYFDAMGTEAQD